MTYAPHPPTGTRLPNGVGRLFTCGDCGAEFSGDHRVRTDGTPLCRDCAPIAMELDEDQYDPDRLRRADAEAPRRRHGTHYTREVAREHLVAEAAERIAQGRPANP